MTEFLYNKHDNQAARQLARPIAALLKIHAPGSHLPEESDEIIYYCPPCTAAHRENQDGARWKRSEGTIYTLWPCPALVGAGFTLRDWGIWQEAFSAGVTQERESHADYHSRNAKMAQMVADLNRCPHGRHTGDTCAGWRGPGDYDGGCRGGRSLGNPMLPPGTVIGTGLSGRILYRVPLHGAPRHEPASWEMVAVPPGSLADHIAGGTQFGALSLALRDANRALLAAGLGPFAPGVGQLDPIPVAFPGTAVNCRCPMPSLEEHAGCAGAGPGEPR